MIAETATVIGGVKALMDSYFTLKGVKNTVPKAQITINKVLDDGDTLAINLSVINVTNKPFSLINLFIQSADKRFEACSIININKTALASNDAMCSLEADTFTFDCDIIEEGYNLNPFNIHAYLLENQAETGWVLFKMNTKDLVVSNIGLKISGVDEILYAK